MKTFSYLWQYVATFFWEWEIFQTQFVEKSKHAFVFNYFLFRKSFHLLDNVEKFGEAERPQMTTWRSVACWIIKATRAKAQARARDLHTHPHTHTHTHTHTEQHVILIAFPQRWLRKCAQCYVISTLPVLFILMQGMKICILELHLLMGPLSIPLIKYERIWSMCKIIND